MWKTFRTLGKPLGKARLEVSIDSYLTVEEVDTSALHFEGACVCFVSHCLAHVE